MNITTCLLKKPKSLTYFVVTDSQLHCDISKLQDLQLQRIKNEKKTRVFNIKKCNI